MSVIDEIFQPNLIAHDLFHMLTGEQLGAGMSRTVYDWSLIKNAVVKFEQPDFYQNVNEWQTWSRIQETDLAKWFAPCLDISPCGRVLIQAKTKPLDGKLPDQLPAFFTDTKAANFGIYKGRVVCHDYGLHLMLEKGMTKRMRKVEWW
ncbi:hypothetical protein [Marinobacter sp. OP 3.4]|uniref:hypothetical protein n=1 Tax=Marinobacter sp. OP 3.4 TaxID=3076501 RepID=UPI002E22C36E